MSNPLISIIVPVYNTEKYLPKCIESILSQTYTNYELILVDDGSSDRCPGICDEYADKDTRIKVIHKENGSVSSARNSGLSIAKGMFVMFMDSDDYYAQDHALQKLVQQQSEQDADLVCFSYSKEDANGHFSEVKINKGYYEDSSFESAMLLAFPGLNCTPNKTEYLTVSVVNKVYKRKIINDNQLTFDETLRKAEDLIFNFSYLMVCKNIVNIDECLYVYRYTPGSIMRTYNAPREIGVERSVYIFSKILEQLKLYSVQEEKYKNILSKRLIRIVIDSNESTYKNLRAPFEKIRAMKNVNLWFHQYLKVYQMDLVKPQGIKFCFEYILVKYKLVMLQYVYAFIMSKHHREL